MGGSSSSSSEQTSSQSSVSGVNTGNIAQGGGQVYDVPTGSVFNSGRSLSLKDVTIEQIPQAVSDAFKQLIDLQKTSAVGAAQQLNDVVGAFQHASEGAVQPDKALTEGNQKLIMLGIAAVVAVMIFKRG